MIAITAANGRLGQAIMRATQNHIPAQQVRLTARTPEKLEDFLRQGFDVARADYDDPKGMEKAFSGIETLMLISGAGPNEIRIANHRAAIDAAKKAGVSRVIYTSFINPVPQSKFIWALPHVDTEAYLKASGLTYVILRDNQYAANVDSLLSKAKESGIYAVPGADGKVAYITHQDISAAIVGVMTGKGHDNKIYELTGPEAFNAYDIAAVLSEALNRKITAVEAPFKDFEAYFRSIGMPDFVVEGMLSMYAASGAGEYSAVSNDVATLAGRPPQSLREYIKNFVKR
jgi:NAD(P)H dehydrogenase (quinone)